MADARWYLVDVVGDQYQRWTIGIGGQVGERVDELFSPAEIEPGRRFVQQDHTRIVHECPGEEHALLLSRRQRPE